MDKTLVIAEKPSVGRDIAKVLKCTQKGDGYLQSEEYIVSWAIGHLVTLCEPDEYSPTFKRWNIDTLPIIPNEIKLKPIKNTKKQLNILKTLFADKSVTQIICATDSGREGELIFRYIYSILKCKKPFKRLWISSMTDDAIKEGFSKLKDGKEYDNLYLSAKCRSESDWLVGINATRAYTIKYNALLSIGRVQTPTLAILVERQKEIDAFVPKDYWEIKAFFEGYTALWYDKDNNDTKIFEKQKSEEIAEKVKGKIGIVESMETEEKKQPPPLLYDLTELQRDCNRRFGYSAQQTLNIAQDLYEKRKLITYPRTDSRYLSNDIIPKLEIILKNISQSEFSDYCPYVLGLEKLPITKRIVDNSKVTDHHAIIPTEKKINVNNLSKDEFNVYDLIIRKFIAVFHKNYIYNITKIVTVVEGESFITKGTVIAQMGWMELYKNDKKDKKTDDENEILPNVNINDEIPLNDINVLKKKTTPPKPYTEATLLSAMENAGRFIEDEDLKEQLKESGLGTPATRAAIIERLLQVGYIQRKGKAINPTEKGMKLIEIVPQELKSPETTGKWEKGLMSISKGSMKDDRFMGSIVKYVNYIVEDCKKSKCDVKFPEEEKKGYKNKKKAVELGVCPKCGNGSILENTKAYYCTNWKTGCRFTIWKNSLELYGNTINNSLVKKLIKDKKVVGISIVLPQTKEKCTADLVFKEDMSGSVEIVNLKRV